MTFKNVVGIFASCDFGMICHIIPKFIKGFNWTFWCLCFCGIQKKRAKINFEWKVDLSNLKARYMASERWIFLPFYPEKFTVRANLLNCKALFLYLYFLSPIGRFAGGWKLELEVIKLVSNKVHHAFFIFCLVPLYSFSETPLHQFLSLWMIH